MYESCNTDSQLIKKLKTLLPVPLTFLKKQHLISRLNKITNATKKQKLINKEASMLLNII